MGNATLEKFGYPGSVVAEGERWALLVRPVQVTLGSLVLVCKEPVQALGDVSPEGFRELGAMSRQTEVMLRRAFDYDRINYLLLMMVDPDVHFHVIPRYAGERSFAQAVFGDPDWPGPPDLGRALEVDADFLERLRQHLASLWSS